MSVEQKCVVKGQLLGSVQTRNVFYGDVQLAGTDTYELVWKNYLTNIMSHISNWISSAWTVGTIAVYDRSGSTWFLIGEYVYTPTMTGDSNVLANLVAGVLLATVAGSHAHGRKFFSGLAEAAVQGNSLVSLAMIDFVLAAADYVALYTSPAGSTLSPGIITKDAVFRPFISGFVSQLLGTMRRRKPGLGI